MKHDREGKKKYWFKYRPYRSSISLRAKTQQVQTRQKRNQLSLLLDFLEATKEPIRTSRLIHRTGVNYYQFTRYTALLLKLKMVTPVSDPFRGFLITERGLMLLKLFASD